MDDPDQALLERARAGDGAALEALLERHQAQIYRFGMTMCRDPEDAKDVLQDTLVAMARGIREFRGASSLSTWLYTIARSHCIKRHRRSKFVQEERSLDADPAAATALPDPTRGPDEAVAGKEVEEALAEAIDALEPTYREVLVLRDVEGLTAPEVGEVLGISAAAVKTRLHRARLAVRAHVAPRLGIPEAPAAAGTCPDVLTMFSQHLEHEIDAEVCAQMERHLEGCARCRGACDSLKRTLALCRTTAPAAPVPPSVQAAVKLALRATLRDGA